MTKIACLLLAIPFFTQAQVKWEASSLTEGINKIVEQAGLLPMQMPMDMSTVEKEFEDVPHDMVPYKDANGHVYDFGYGLNWKGVIKDERTEKYKVQKK